MAEFGDRIDELQQSVGNGALLGKLVVDQVYAQIQHEDLTLKHQPGRKARYLAEPLFDRNNEHMNRLADAVLGGDLPGAMAGCMEDLSDQVEQVAPIDFDDLPRSSHPTVVDDNALVYNRPPIVPRLTEEQLKQKSKLKNKGGF